MGYRDAPIEIRPEKETYDIKVFGDETVAVTVDDDGCFRGAYRKEALWGSADHVRKAVQRAESEASERKDRVKRLKQAETDPVPAVLFIPHAPARGERRARYPERGTIPAVPAQPARLERVGIRGVDKRSREALIIRADGSRESVRWDRLLRPLMPGQEASLFSLLRAHEKAQAAVPSPERFSDVAERLPALELTAAYDDDPDVEGWIVRHDGKTFFSDGYRPFDAIRTKIAAHEVAKTHPWAEQKNRVVALVELAEESTHFSFTEIFKTREEAEAFIAAGQAVSDAYEAWTKAFDRLKFDRVRFTNEEES